MTFKRKKVPKKEIPFSFLSRMLPPSLHTVPHSEPLVAHSMEMWKTLRWGGVAYMT